MNNADNILFRCSSLGHIMTEPNKFKTVYFVGDAEVSAAKYNSLIDKAVDGLNLDALALMRQEKVETNEVLAEGTKTHLIDVYVQNKYGRKQDITSKYMEKGLMVEEDSITLFSRVNKTFYRKNEEKILGLYIAGTPDLFTGDSITSAESIVDIKSSWDIFTYFRTRAKDMNKMYYWQLMGYMALTGAKTATLAYCLVNTPDTIINDEKRKLSWKMGLIDDANPDFQKACEDIDRLSIYDDIPLNERVYTIQVERDEAAINAIYERVIACREWMNENLFIDK